MGNVTLPTPVFAAGGALCLLAGYLAGSVLGADTPDNSTATVASYDPQTSEICLSGKAVEEEKTVDEDGRLCGRWSHSSGVRPRKGDRFRFVTLDQRTAEGGDEGVVIFGTVVK